jgi:hypothetical protein
MFSVNYAVIKLFLVLFLNDVLGGIPVRFMLLIWPNFGKLLLGILFVSSMNNSARTP